MPPERSGVSISALRAAVQQRIEQTTLRRVAKDIGMSPSGLWSFVQADGQPYGATYQKLTAWYVREQSRRGNGISDESIQAALSLLVAQLPRATQSRVKQEIVAVIAAHLPTRKRARWLRSVSESLKNRLTSRREN